MSRAKLGRWLILIVGLVYLGIWSVSLGVALQDHSHEIVRPDGHGSLEAAVMTLVGLTQPLGLLAGAVMGLSAPSGRAGIVAVWVLAGLLGAVQWVAVGAAVRTIWAQFRPARSTLQIK